MVLIHMHAAKFQTLSGYPWAHQLTHAIVLCKHHVVSPGLVHLLAHSLRHEFTAHQANLYLQFFLDINPDFFCNLRNPKCIRRGCNQKGRRKVFHKHNLLFRIARGGRNNSRSYLLQSVMQAQGACKHAISKTNLCNIPAGGSSHACDPCHTFGPYIQIPPGISHNRRFPSSTAGSMNSAEVLLGYRKKTKGIIIPHILFCSKRQPLQIFQRTDILRHNPCLLHLLSVCRNLSVHTPDRFLQPLQLYRLDISS